ncbi:hypothetical protein [Priestia megaterium]|nr:hypothetical protein [Priestia megaterium]
MISNAYVERIATMCDGDRHDLRDFPIHAVQHLYNLHLRQVEFYKNLKGR